METEKKHHDFDVVIIGAGGAGMMTAIHAGRRGRRVVMLDHSENVGRKILISGGGRCNFTNVHSTSANFLSNNPHFCKSAFSRFGPTDFIALVQKHKIAFHEKKLGQLFCDHSAEQIVTMLVDECLNAGANFSMQTRISSVSRDVESNRFEVETNRGIYRSDKLVIATGGLSIPQIGATAFGLNLARQFGLSVIETAPALDGFVFSEADRERFSDLTGVAKEVVAKVGKIQFRENILFTHVGLSGPASLQASLYWRSGTPLQINLMPEENCFEWLKQCKNENGKTDIKNIFAARLPKRLAEKLCEEMNLHGNISALAEKTLERLSLTLTNWQIMPSRTVGYRKAEVMRGGVDTKELSSQTMESKKTPGLFFVGEVVDVTGQLGGHNFQWAWSSGFSAGNSV